MPKKLLTFFASVILFTLSSSITAAADSISLQVQNAEIKDVLQAAASLAGKNILTDDSVKGRISVSFKDLPLATALDIITCIK